MAPKHCEIRLTFNFGEHHFKKSGGLKYYRTAGITNITTVHCVTSKKIPQGFYFEHADLKVP